MTRILYLPIIIVLAFFPSRNKAYTCTAFSLVKKDTSVVGKNLDWPIGEGHIIINQRNIRKYSWLNNNLAGINWTSRYGSVTLNQFGKEFPLGGMNEAGLVVEELSCSPTVYNQDKHLPGINELQWIQYQLDNFATVEEVINHLSGIRIEKWMFGLHYFVADRYGRTAIIEFLEGKPAVFFGDNLPLSVLSNNSYENSLQYLKHYEGFGGKNKIVEGRTGSQERFLQVAYMLNFPGESEDGIIDFAYEILNRVSQSDTQWSIVYDLTNLHIRLRTADREEIHLIDLQNFTFSNCLVRPLPLRPVSVDGLRGFMPFSQCKNSALLNAVMLKLADFSCPDFKTVYEINNDLAKYLLDLDNVNQ